MDIEKPLPPALSSKYSKEVIELYNCFRRKANDSPIVVAWYAQIDNVQLPQTHNIVKVPLRINEANFCFEAIHNAITDLNFVRWI